MAAITSMGIGSGLDIAGIISQLMVAERQPEQDMITKEADFTAQLTALGTVKGAVSTFQTSVQALSSASQFGQMTASVGDSTVATATAVSTATAGTHSLVVDQLAQNQSLKTTAYQSVDSVIGTGHLSIQFGQINGQLKSDGTYRNATGESGTPPEDTSAGAAPIPATFTVNAGASSLDIDITSSNNTLAGIRDAINAKHAGVNASIVNDGSGFRLVLSSAAGGAKSSMRISVTNDGDSSNTDNAGLSQLAFDPTQAVGSGQNLVQAQKGQDAAFSLDGISITRSSNTVSDALNGVTLNLLKAGSGATSLSIGQDTSSVLTNVQNFVKGYNDLQTQLKQLTAYDPTTKTAAVLQGDSTIRNLQYQVRETMNGMLVGSGSYRTLSSVGISFDKDGTMTFDSSKLSTALSTDPDGVAALFGVNATTTDGQISYVNSTGNTKVGNYAISITQLATQGILRGGAASSTDFSADASPTLSLSVDGIQSGTITLDQKNYASYADVAADMQSKINGDNTLKAAGVTVSVTYDTTANRFVFSSARYGSSSSVQVTNIDSTLGSQLGLSSGSQATIFGGSLMTNTIDSSNDTLSLAVDGGPSTTITLTDGTYTGQSLAAEIQNQLDSAGLNAMAVYNSGANRIELASKTIGSNSAIQITGIDSATASSLGLAQGKGQTTGQDVGGSIGGSGATGAGQYLTGLGDASGLNILVNGGIASPVGATRGTIAFNKGFAYQLDQLFTSALSDTGILTADTNGIQTQITDLQTQQTRFEERMTQIQAMYTQQFTDLDTTIAQLKQTSSSLSQQLASLPKAS